MESQYLRTHLSIKILDNPKEIIKCLQIGINIPVLPEFYTYILKDLEYYKAKSVLLREDGNPVGHVLIYTDGTDTLYFGYFGVLNHNEKKISFLIDEIIKHAKINNYKIIRGPINVPAIIFGWGFMKEGSLESLFVGKPINPPIYQNLFLKKDFYVKSEQDTWIFSPITRFNPLKMRTFDFSEYEYFYPKDVNEFMKYRYEFLRLHAENLPASSQITPNVAGTIDNYSKFVYKYGYNFMVFFVRHKPTNKVIACGVYLPNPFRKNKKGEYDSCSYYTEVVDIAHRRKGIAMLMFGATSLQLRRKKIRYSTAPIGSDNKASIEVAKILGGVKGMTHLILEYQI